MDKRSVRRLLRVGFLSPRIIEAIAEGHQPPDLTVFSLMRRVDLPLYASQRKSNRLIGNIGNPGIRLMRSCGGNCRVGTIQLRPRHLD